MFRKLAIVTVAIGALGVTVPAVDAAPNKKPAATAKVVRHTATKVTTTTTTKVTTKPAGRHAGSGAGGANKNFGNKNAGGKNSGGNKNAGGTKNTANTNLKTNTNNALTTTTNKNFKFQGSKKVGFQGGNNARIGGRHNAVKFSAGPGRVSRAAFKPASNVKFVRLGNRSAPMWRGGQRRMWWGNKWRVFVPLTALGVVALGGAYYYPDAYLTVARPYCEGITPEGCRLNWQRVEFEDGDGDWQCVQYCRRPGAPPPARTVALAAPPPPPQNDACEISIFSEPNFAGTNATATDEQPRLNETGWQNQIASVKVAAGTWDFFSDPEFTGETMRLQPGEYPDLGAEWAKKAGSFMCVQP
jgi:hypothetical protein